MRANLQSPPPSFDDCQDLDSPERENRGVQPDTPSISVPLNSRTDGEIPAMPIQEQETSPIISQPKHKGKEIMHEVNGDHSPKRVCAERDSSFMVGHILELVQRFAPPLRPVPEPTAPSSHTIPVQATSQPDTVSKSTLPPPEVVPEQVTSPQLTLPSTSG